MLAGCTLALTPLCAQEIPRPSEARNRAPQANLPPPNFELGPIQFSFAASLTTEYIDNVYLTNKNPIDDFVLEPQVDVTAVWPLTDRNTLRLRTSFGYEKYLGNPRLDQTNLTVAPDSALQLFVYIGDFRLELHDQFSLQNDTSQYGSLAGVASLPRFTNTVGSSLLWDLSDLKLTIGADHYNFLTLGSAITAQDVQVNDPGDLDHTTDQVSASANFSFGWGQAGLESTIAYSNYPQDSGADFIAITAGPAIQWQPTRYTAFSMSAGYKQYIYTHATQPELTVTNSGFLTLTDKPVDEAPAGFYASLGVNHRLNRYYTDRLDIGHDDVSDAITGRTESNYVRYSFSYLVNSKLTIAGACSLSDDREQQGNLLLPTPAEDYRVFTLEMNATFKLMPKVNLGLGYAYTKRFGQDVTQNYAQNRVQLTLGYSF